MVWIRAETSDVRVNQNGHCYLEFIERDRSGKMLIAKARGMIWANTYHLLKAYFENTTKQPFASGLKVLVQVSVEFHELYGFSLTVHDIDPGYTLGDQAINRAAILKQLEEEGVLHLNKELELSVPANRIAIISSPTAAGYEDFLDQLGRNTFGFAFYTKLFPSIMQGERSEDSIIQALERIYKYQDCFDAVVIIRGGGATSDLSCFDSYLLAACCAQFPLPVITGIGHERDETVLDIVAHTRAKTPTAVAEFLIGNLAETATELSKTAHDIVTLALQRLQDEAVRLNVFGTKNIFALRSCYKEQEAILSSVKIALIKEILRIRKEKQLAFTLMEDNLKKKAQQLCKDEQAKLAMLEKHLQLSSPENILKKGYTLTMRNGTVIKQSTAVKRGDEITTVFADGEIESIVK
jgi:exodeoxyribonuclease VII large subunit